MERTLRYICEHINEQLSLKDVAEHAGYSVWHFCQKFRQYTGVTFSEYVRNRRMYLAVCDMQRGETVTDVALRYGYDSLTGFEKAFLKVFRCTPSEFLKNVDKCTKAYEEIRGKRFQLSERCRKLRDETLCNKQRDEILVGQYRKWFDAGYQSLPNKLIDNGVLLTKCLCSVIENYPTVIFDEELIVGNNYGCDTIMETERKLFDPGFDPEFVRAYLRKGTLSHEEIEKMIQSHSDPNNTMFTRMEGYHCDLDVFLNDKSELAAVTELAAVGYCTAHNHSVLDYGKVLKYGFRGLLEQVRNARAKNADLDEQKINLYNSMEELLESCCKIGKRYAKEAERLAMKAPQSRAEELLKIAEICERVPEYPARSLHEAIQSLWFAHIINTWEDGVNANSLGRLDQILYPYYCKDIESGILTEERAFELLCCLWIKLYRDYDVQHLTIGGCDRNGNCAVNALSYLMLDVTEALNFVRCLSVRFSQHTPRKFLRRSLEVVRHVQKGIPGFFNDDVIIEALYRSGIEIEDAREYAVIGCVEICIPGKSNPHSVSARINMLKALEYALGNGRSIMNPHLKPGINTGDPSLFKSFNDLKEAVRKQMNHLIDIACRQVNSAKRVSAKYDCLPYKSILTEGCIEKGKHFNEGGPKYNYYQFMIMGLPNLADSLEALRQFVYVNKQYSLTEVIKILEKDFPDENIRLAFLNGTPKFGNNQASVDSLASMFMNYACSYIKSIPSEIGGGFHPQLFTFSWMLEHGALTTATPDGRRKGEPLAYGCSPAQGRDFNGLIALLNSISQLPTKEAPGSTSAIIEVDPYLMNDMNIDMLIGVLLGAAEKGLSHVQFNVIDNNTLINAKKYPEKYKDLAVQVYGVSQKFVMLDKRMQDYLIGCTKHSVI